MSRYPFIKMVIPLGITIVLSDVSDMYVSSPNLVFMVLVFFIILAIFLERKRYRRLSSILCYLLLCLMGFITHQLHFNNNKPDTRDKAQEIHPSIATVIDIEQKKKFTVLKARIDFTSGLSASVLNQSKALLYIRENNEFYPGDKLLVYSVKNKIGKNRNPYAYDYKLFMQRKGIFYQLFPDSTQWILLSHSTDLNLKSLTSVIRENIYTRLKSVIPDKDNLAIISAMMLGKRSLISEEINDDFKRTGAIHVLAVSGLHVGIISSILFVIFNVFKCTKHYYKHMQLVCLLLVVWTFAFVSGASYSVIRAAVMFSLYYIGKSISRPGNIYNFIGITAFIMLLIEPMSIYDIGFQFSFLALCSIVYFYPKIEPLLFFKYKILKKIWQLIVVSLSAQVLVFPLSIYYFHMFPNYFWLSGIAVVPLAAASLSMCIATITSSIFKCQFLTEALAEILGLLLSGFRQITSFIESLPFACIEDICINGESVWLLYGIIFLLMLTIQLKQSRYIYYAGIGYIFMITLHINTKIKAWSSFNLCIYDVYKRSLIDVFYAGKHASFRSENLTDTQIQFNAYQNRIRFYPKEAWDLSQTAQHVHYTSCDGNTFGIYPTQFISPPSSCLDYLILNNSSFHLLDDYVNNCKVDFIILDSSINHVSQHKISLIRASNITLHHTKADGPFIIQSNL